MPPFPSSDFADIEASLPATGFGHPFHFYEFLNSTNARAMELARQGALEGTLVLAEVQTAGRGRLGRRWLSPPAKSLLFSLILRPSLPSQAASQVTLVLALAVAEILRDKYGLAAEIKWPNDVLIGGRKICGILVEMEGQLDRLDFMVAGIGLNTGQEDSDWPAELKGLATSLKMENGQAPDRAELLKDFLGEAGRLYQRLLNQEFPQLLQEWQAFSCMTGRQVRALGPGGREILGMAIGLDPDGALQVRLDNGIIERIIAGDVTLLRER
jgi:BirA family transcriptional regulator, biotin operon repressor / biotin---[acetyl-CoA-carboxylase] ligase